MIHKELDYNNHTIHIKYDDSADSPRDWDNLGTLAVFMSSYSLNESGFVYAEDLQELLKTDDYIYLPVYCYQHGNIAFNTSGFSCPWDSGHVGWIYADSDKIRKNFGCKYITKKIIKQVRINLQCEIETLSKYMNGEVYGYAVYDETNELIDSCYGYYSTDDALQDAKSAVDYEVNKLPKQIEMTLI